MENSINVSAIELYARKAAKPFVDHFFNSEKLKGKDIVQFCPIEQVNYFILQQLFAKWQEETSNLRSPYFDYSQEEVKQAMKVFMGQLSQFILIGKEDFSPLLVQSIFNTIYYSVAPVSFLGQKYLVAKKNYNADELANLFKYLKLHPKIMDFMKLNISRFDERNGKEIAFIIESEFGAKYVNKEIEQIVLNLFNKVLPVLPSDFHYEDATSKQPSETHLEEPAQVTINDLIKRENKSTVLHMHVKNKVIDLRSAMSINQKFMFIKELFKGDSLSFEAAMSLADGCENYEKAVGALIDAYSQHYNWEIDSEEVNELFDLIGRKFYPDTFEK